MFTKYFKPEEHTVFPKFILYSAHAETVAPFYLAFNQPDLITNPEPASGVFIQYMQCKNQFFCGNQTDNIRVRVYYASDPRNLSTWQALNLTLGETDHSLQSKDLSMDVTDFQKWLDGVTEEWYKGFGVKSGTPMKEVCQVNYTHTADDVPYTDPLPIQDALYSHYDIKMVKSNALTLYKKLIFSLSLLMIAMPF